MSETPAGTAAARRAMLRVHQEHCQGHARCSAIAPELFTQNGIGTVVVIGDGGIPPALTERARLAAACCPEAAIEILQD